MPGKQQVSTRTRFAPFPCPMCAHKKILISVGGCALSGLRGGHGYWATSALPAHGGGDPIRAAGRHGHRQWTSEPCTALSPKRWSSRSRSRNGRQRLPVRVKVKRGRPCTLPTKNFLFLIFLSPILHSATGFAVVHIALASAFAVQAVTSANRLFSDIPKLGYRCLLSGVKRT